MAQYIDSIKMPSGDKYGIADSYNWRGTPILTVEFTTANNTGYYDAIHITPTSTCTSPQGAIVFTVEGETVRSGVTYKDVAYCRTFNTYSLDYSLCYQNWVTNQNTQYCPVYYRIYYPTTASTYATNPLKLCFRNYSDDITSCKYTIKIYEIPEGFKVEEGTKALVSTTNYSAGTNSPIYANGLQETGDNSGGSTVTNTLAPTVKSYVTGTPTETTNTGELNFDTDVYLTTTAGELNANSYRVANTATIVYNTTTGCLEVNT